MVHAVNTLYHEKNEKTIEMEEIYMRIILEGTETELRNTLRSFGITSETVVDNGTEIEFVTGSIFDSHNKEISKITKNHAKRRRQVYLQLHPSSQQV